MCVMALQIEFAALKEAMLNHAWGHPTEVASRARMREILHSRFGGEAGLSLKELAEAAIFANRMGPKDVARCHARAVLRLDAIDAERARVAAAGGACDMRNRKRLRALLEDYDDVLGPEWNNIFPQDVSSMGLADLHARVAAAVAAVNMDLIESCAICLEPVMPSTVCSPWDMSRGVVLPCNHIIHSRCMRAAMVATATDSFECPFRCPGR